MIMSRLVRSAVPYITLSFLTSFSAEAEARNEHMSAEKLYDLLKDQSTCSALSKPSHVHPFAGERLRLLEDDNRRLSDALDSCLEDLHHMRNVSVRPQAVRSDDRCSYISSTLFAGRGGESCALTFVQMGLVCQAL